MKKISDFVKNLIIIAYILVIIFVTICLLSYNDYGVAVLDGNTLFPVIDSDLEPNYSVGDLLIVKKNKLTDVKAGDSVFFYRTVAGEVMVNFATITDVEAITLNEYTFTIEGDYKFSSSNFIGKVDTTKVIPNVGRILSILQSKWGFLFLGVFPSLMAFLYTLYTVVLEVQVPEEDENKQKKKSKSKTSKKLSNDISPQNKQNENLNVEKDKSIKENKEEKLDNQVEKTKENKEKGEITKQQKINEEKKNVSPINLKENKEETNEEVKEETKNVNVTNEILENNKITSNKINEKTNLNNSSKQNRSQNIEEKKKALIEAKMKSMTEEEKKALIKAKLDAMTDEEKRALIEAKRKKMEAQKKEIK